MIRNLSLAKSIVRSNFRRLSFPYKLTFVLTFWCNYRCKTCNIWQMRPKDELTLDEIRQFFRTSNQFNWIDLTGGEVWLRKDFVDISEACLTHCKDLALFHFPTNGYLTERIVEGVKEILKMKPPKFIITVSMDGDEATNDDIRGREGGWQRQMETFRKLKELKGVETVLGMTVSKYNIGTYRKTVDAVKQAYPELDPKDLHVNIVQESAHYYNNVGQHDHDDIQDQLIDEVKAYEQSRGRVTGPVSFLEKQYLKNVEKYLRSGKTPMPCHALKSSCFIDSWGKVYPCNSYDKVVGDLREYDYDLEKIWNLPTTKELQEEIYKGQCPHCWTPCEAYQTILGNLI